MPTRYTESYCFTRKEEERNMNLLHPTSVTNSNVPILRDNHQPELPTPVHVHQRNECSCREQVNNNLCRDDQRRRKRRLVSNIMHRMNQTSQFDASFSIRNHQHEKSWEDSTNDTKDLYFACSQYFSLRALALLKLQQKQQEEEVEEKKTIQETIGVDDSFPLTTRRDDKTYSAVQLYILYAKHCDLKRKRTSDMEEVDEKVQRKHHGCEEDLQKQRSHPGYALTSNRFGAYGQIHLNPPTVSVESRFRQLTVNDDYDSVSVNPSSEISEFQLTTTKTADQSASRNDNLECHYSYKCVKENQKCKPKRHKQYKHGLEMTDYSHCTATAITSKTAKSASSSTTETVSTSTTDCTTLSSCSSTVTEDADTDDEYDYDNLQSVRHSSLIFEAENGFAERITSEQQLSMKHYPLPDFKNHNKHHPNLSSNIRANILTTDSSYHGIYEGDSDTMEEDELAYECQLLKASIEDDIDRIDHLISSSFANIERERPSLKGKIKSE